MNALEFFTQDELDDTPEDDEAAFLYLVEIAQRRLSARTDALEKSEQWDAISEARHGFMNVTIALARAHKIEPFASMQVPTVDAFGHGAHQQFRADLDFYLTQLLVSNSRRARHVSVSLPEGTKAKIRTYIHGIRQVIDAATDMPEARKNALLKRVSDLEAALEKRRFGLQTAMIMAIAIMGVPGELGDSYDVVSKLISSVFRELAVAKVQEEQNRELPPSEPRIALSPPRRESPPRKKQPDPFLPDLDDEIPF